jgi:hypothetical protein
MDEEGWGKIVSKDSEYRRKATEVMVLRLNILIIEIKDVMINIFRAI